MNTGLKYFNAVAYYDYTNCGCNECHDHWRATRAELKCSYVLKIKWVSVLPTGYEFDIMRIELPLYKTWRATRDYLNENRWGYS